MRDHNRVLADALQRQGADVTVLWWERDQLWNTRRVWRELEGWVTRVRTVAADLGPDWIVWSYSGFTWSYRGIPLFVPKTARRLAASGVPVAVFGHELVYPWGLGGLRGRIQALTQRAVLIPMLRNCRGLITTTDELSRWVGSRRWLARRPSTVIPVSSNLPGVLVDNRHETGADGLFVVGVFGFGAPSFVPEPVARAIATLRRRGVEICLVLVGSPGPSSPEGALWRRECKRHGCADALAFTGVLPAVEVAHRLAGVDVVVFPDWPGPMSRRTTLAAALALGRPVVAFDGPYTWQPLVEERAILVIPPNSDGLVDALHQLQRDPRQRMDLGSRGLAFYNRRMSPDVAASELLRLLGSAARQSAR